MKPMMGKPGAKKPIPPKVMKKVEASKQDMARDKRMGIKENSAVDRKMDAAQARRQFPKLTKGKNKDE